MQRERWNRLWCGRATPASTGSWFDRLASSYNEPHRAYHNGTHIDECLDEFDVARGVAGNAFAVEAALWFHDAVYDTRISDNEERSAALAAQCLREHGEDDVIVAVVTELILATKTHRAAESTSDAELVADIDLAILGRPHVRFAEYCAQIRSEYAWVDEGTFREKRAAILRAFLERDRLFMTDVFRAKYEKAARRNLALAIDALRG